MSELIVDAALREKLDHLDGPVQFRDEAGRIVGYFYPMPEPVDPEVQGLQSPHSLEELELLRSQRCGRPLSEILDRLRQL